MARYIADGVDVVYFDVVCSFFNCSDPKREQDRAAADASSRVLQLRQNDLR